MEIEDKEAFEKLKKQYPHMDDLQLLNWIKVVNQLKGTLEKKKVA